jgi:hypothetical protein
VESIRDLLIGNGLSLYTSTLERIAKRKKKLPFPEFHDERGHERMGSQRVRIVSRWPD